MIGKEIRQARAAAMITGEILSRRAGISRTRLSEIERGFRKSTPEEERRLTTALRDLLVAKQKIEAFAAEIGWPAEAG